MKLINGDVLQKRQYKLSRSMVCLKVQAQCKSVGLRQILLYRRRKKTLLARLKEICLYLCDSSDSSENSDSSDSCASSDSSDSSESCDSSDNSNKKYRHFFVFLFSSSFFFLFSLFSSSFWQNSKTQTVTNLTQIVTKLKNSNCDKT